MTDEKKKKKADVQPLEALNVPDALLRIKTVIGVSGLSRATIYRKLAAGDFPQPVRQGQRCTRWRAGDISDHLKKITQRETL